MLPLSILINIFNSFCEIVVQKVFLFFAKIKIALNNNML